MAGADRPVEVAQRAEALGFDHVASGEHLLFRGPMQNALIALTAAAAVTTRIRLLSSVVLVPLYPPVLLAKMAALVDVISGGRLELGVGLGGDYPKEFEAAGVPVSQRASRTDEALEILTKLFSGGPSDHAGRYLSFTGVAIEPGPVQPGGPPLWIAGRSHAAIGRAARYGGWLPYLMPVERFAQGVVEYRRAAAGLGRPEDGLRCGILLRLTVGADGDRARSAAAERASFSYGRDMTEQVDRLLVAGTPAQCLRRLAAYRDAGADLLLLHLTGDLTAGGEMADLVAAEIMPALRAGG